MKRFRPSEAAVIISATALAVGVPVLADLVSDPKRAPFRWAAADTFYYLSVARNIARHGLPSFDGRFPTNGFHPVWQAVTAVVYWVTALLSRARQAVFAVAVTSLGFVVGAVALLGAGLRRRDGSLSPVFLVLPVGIYGIAVAPLYTAHLPDLANQNGFEGSMPVYGTLYSYVNGMESGVVLFFYALAGLLLVHEHERAEPSPGLAAGIGGALVLLALSRLDHAVIALSLLSGFVGRRVGAAGGRRSAAIALATFGVPFLAYLAMNRLVFGSVVPTSGAVKSTFPLLTGEHVANVKTMLETPLREASLPVALREAQIFLPAVVALSYLPAALTIRRVASGYLVAIRATATPFEHVLVPTALGILVLATYDGLFVGVYSQGHWYFPVSTLFVSLVFVSLASRVRLHLPALVSVPLALGYLAWSIAFFRTLGVHRDYHARYAAFYWDEAPKVRARFVKERFGLIECDDGIVNFSLDLPTMSQSLMLDREALAALHDQRFFRLAFARGFDRVGTLVYNAAQGLRKDHSADAARRWAQTSLPPEDLSAFDFTVDYAGTSGFGIVRGHRK